MNALLQPLLVILLYVTVSAGDKAIRAAMGGDTIRAIVYGIVALLALVAIILALVH